MSPAGGALPIRVLGEALMDCVAQPDGSLRPFMGGSPFNLARAAALRGASGRCAQRSQRPLHDEPILAIMRDEDDVVSRRKRRRRRL